jgi:hypothetical protein
VPYSALALTNRRCSIAGSCLPLCPSTDPTSSTTTPISRVSSPWFATMTQPLLHAKRLGEGHDVALWQAPER